MISMKSALVWGAITAGVITGSPHLQAADPASNLQTGVERLSSAVGDWFKAEERERILSVSVFVNDDGEQSSEFKRLLEAQLGKLKPPVEVRRVDLVLGGRLSNGKGKAQPEDRFDSVSLRVEAQLKQRGQQGDLQSFAINVFGDEALQLLGPTVEFPKDLPETEKQKQLDKQLGTKAEAFLSGTKTLGAEGGKFGIEILASGPSVTPSARTPSAVEGRSFVKLTQGEEYIIRLHNDSFEEAAVALTIDGLGMFAFAEDGTGDSMIIVPPGRSVSIPGWYITKQKTDVFEVSNYAESAAAAKNLPASGIGVITARFHLSQSGEGKGEEATKRGRRIDEEYKEVRRVIGENRAFVTVRYNRDGK